MKITGIDISYIPFSTRDSYMLLNYLYPDFYTGFTGMEVHESIKHTFNTTEGLFLRSVRAACQPNKMEVCMFEPVFEGETLPYELVCDYTRVDMVCEKGKISFCYDDADTLLAEGCGKGLGLRIKWMEKNGGWTTPVQTPEGMYYKRVSNIGSNDTYAFCFPQGKVSISEEWTYDKCMIKSSEYTCYAEDGHFSFVIKDLDTYVWPKPKFDYNFRISEQKMRATFQKFYDSFPSISSRFDFSKKLSIYLLWIATVRKRGFIQRESIMMSKTVACYVWAYEVWLCGWGVYLGDPKLGYDQLLTMFDSQNSYGGIPHSKGDMIFDYTAQMGPSIGWILNRMMRKIEFTDEQIETLYGYIVKLTEYYLNFRDCNQDGLCEYQQGFDSCNDNTSMFHHHINITTPDLSALLILQMDWLSDMAKRLRRHVESAYWKKRSDAMLEKMLEKLFDDQGLAIARDGYTDEPIQTKTPMLLVPLILGDKLPERNRKALLTELTSGGYITKFGVASESTVSPMYNPNDFFRGPIWDTITLFVVDGLWECGEKSLAKDIAVKYCELSENSKHVAECFNPETGKPLCDMSYIVTAGTYLILAYFYMD